MSEQETTAASGPKVKKFMFVNRKAPYGTIYALESLEVVLIDLLLTKPYKDGGSPVNNWDAKGIKVAAHVNGTINDPSDIDKGWTVEIAYPWSALKECAHRDAPPKEGDQWRINFSRVEWDVTIDQPLGVDLQFF